MIAPVFPERQRLRSDVLTIAVCAIALLVPLHAFGQTATATLSGTVLDESGAVIRGASLTLVNFDTVVERKTTANNNGAFTFPFLPPGRYTLTAQHSGFALGQLKDVVLNVGDDVTLQLTLRVERVTTAVSVVGESGLRSQSGAIATIVDRRFVENQPLNGRTFQTLIGLAPGVVFTSAGVTTLGQFSVNGQRANANYFAIDGVSANFGSSTATSPYETSGGAVPSLSVQGGTNALSSIDAVQEFQIQTSTYAPEFGRQPGAQISIVTRSGTNDFHSSAFEYFRNDAMDAADWFANRNGLPKAALRQNDFGGVIGGPIRRNRTFFFGSYEGLRLRQPVVSSPEQVPSLAARQAATGVVRAIVNAFPAPTGAPGTDPNTATFVGSFSNPSTLDSSGVRLDYTLNGSMTLFGRYQHAPSEARVRANFGSASSVAITEQETQSVTVGTTIVLSPRLMGDVRVNYGRSRARVANIVDDFGGAMVPSESTFFPSFTSAESGLSLLAIGPNTLRLGVSQENRQRQVNVVSALSYARGTHALKFGADYRRLTPIADQGAYTRLLNFTNVTQALAEQLSLVLVARADVDLYPIYTNLSLFAQDTWRATSALTLTYGLRYEINPAPDEANGNLPLTVTGLDNHASLQLAPQGTPFYETTLRNVAPRVGVTYALSPERGTMLRAGAGIYYDLGYAFTGAALAPSSFPYGNTVTRSNVMLSTPFVSEPAPTAVVQAPFPALFAYEPDYQLPYTVQYNIGVEQRVGATGTLSASYVAAAGRRLGRAEAVLNPHPSFTRLNVVRNEGTSDYRALQVQFQRRYSRGLQTLAAYTWSEALDNVSEESISNYQAALARYDPALDRGPANFDVRHSVTGAVSYDIPSQSSRAARAILNGFGIDAMFRARSALPVNVVLGSDALGVGTATVARPDLVPGAALYLDDSSVAGGRRINRAAFATPPAGQQGTLGRNALRGFAFAQTDLSIRRRFALPARAAVQVRMDVFNVFNWPNFANPEGRLNNANFGVSTQMLGRSLGAGGVGLSPLYQVGGPRSTQLSFKVEF